MRLVIVDDEPRALKLLSAIIHSLPQCENHELIEFTNSEKALTWLTENRCDGIFLDIEMPEINGMQMAQMLRKKSDSMPAIIFVTAFPQYSLKAWDVDALGYILKPYDEEQIAHAIHKIANNASVNLPAAEKPYCRCFPDFDVFVNGSPVFFSSKRSKELLALLVHNRGGWVPLEKIIFLLLEECPEDAAKSHIRTLLSRLRQSLDKYGIADIIESNYGKMRVVPEKFNCDYYQYLEGSLNLFKGEYMGSYTWAEEERAYLLRKNPYDSF